MTSTYYEIYYVYHKRPQFTIFCDLFCLTNFNIKKCIIIFVLQLILGGEGAYTGDFSLLLNGVYGDDIHLSEANSELIPLLKRVIALLQENGISLSATRLQPAGYPTGSTAVAEERPSRRMVALQKEESSLPASVIIHEGKTKVWPLHMQSLGISTFRDEIQYRKILLREKLCHAGLFAVKDVGTDVM